MMSAFDKDDYLKDLPDAEDAAPHAQSSQPADTGSPHHDAMPSSPASTAGDNAQDDDASASGSAAVGGNDVAAHDDGSQDDAQEPQEDTTPEGEKPSDTEPEPQQDTLTPLGQAKKEAAEYLEALQRERAEFVNFRNRSNKEQQRFREHGIIDVLSALLPALDDIDRIRAHSDIDESFNAVATKIDKAFAKFGVEKFGEVGEAFDPVKHEAVLHKPDPDATKETVDTVVEAGYRIGDRVIRAARVVVASPKN